MSDDEEFAGLLTLPPEEESPSYDSLPDTPLCQAEGCPNPTLPYGGRGPRPKFCADHKRRTSPREEGSGSLPRAPRKSAKMEARLAQLEDDLTREFALFGKGLSAVLPVTGTTMFGRAPKVAKVLTRMAADNPKLLEIAETSTKVINALDLGENAAAIGIAILVDLGRMNPDGVLPGMLGVSETYHAIHDEEPTIQPSTVNGHVVASPFNVDVPPRFAEVR